MLRLQASYWLSRAEEERRLATEATIAAVRTAHEKLAIVCRDHAASIRDWGIVLGPPAYRIDPSVRVRADNHRA